jgi:hypothetical protein
MPRTPAVLALALAAALHLAAVPALAASAAAPPEIDPADKPVVEAFLGHAEKAAVYCTPERLAKFAAQPEDITWQASKYVGMPLVAYQLTGDAKWLDAFVQRMDALCGCMTKGPDGFLGWYGLPLDLFRHPDHPQRKVDVMLTSFVVSGQMADFARIVRSDAALRPRFAPAADRYMALARDHLVRKWEARGCWHVLADGTAVYSTHPDLAPVKASLTQPHNKHAKIGRALIALYAATGDDAFMEKAVRLAARFKRCLTLDGDRYIWNYWDPAGPWDVDPANAGKWKHWIGPEHRGGYYGLSLSQAVVAYEHALVFDRADMDRFIRTQVGVAWNGDADAPKWARVDGRAADHAYLSEHLAPLDERVWAIAFGPPAQKERLAGRDHGWQGGVAAADWLEMKYVHAPRWKGGKPGEADVAAKFLAKPANRALAERLSAPVVGPGYQAPQTPADMKAAAGGK